MTTSCPACRARIPDGARFCPSCGAALGVDTGLTTERKIVSTLFADLVGFTALSERRDPEDVDVALRAYFDLARGAIEHFGGVVEKFIGDAVVGLFGAPTAREDDAERAVRAALEIVARMEELPPLGSKSLEVRAAVNTGPALVRLLAVPGAGQGVLVGDAINTASRLLATARPMSVVVGERTHTLTVRTIAYRPLGRQPVRGKQRLVERWLAVGPLARRGVDLSHSYAAPLVGREVESGILEGLFARACASLQPQSALVTGEAGVGKSRLVLELARWIDRQPGIFANWRQGRCLPYGEGSGFQPLAEVVRAHAGVSESDDDDGAAAKLDRTVPDGPDHDWLVDRLRPLVGLPSRMAEQEENFRAWALFLDGVARERPTVVFFDDLHWADDCLLAFLDHMVQNRGASPLLLLGACRPELFERRPDVPGYLGAATGDAPVTHIDLASLSTPETERLVGELSPDVPLEIRTVIVDRSGGNPFYAEELVRLLHTDDRRAPDEWLSFESLPDSLQALLTARLDALDSDHKGVLADAAVAGLVFSPALVAAMGSREPDDVRRMLAELTAREFVRPAPDDGPPPGDRRFAFWHAMTRDAAYSQLPRAARAEKHAAAADWIEHERGDRIDDLVDAVADHRVSALELAEAAGLHELAADQRIAAVSALTRAGDHALGLDVKAAEAHYAKAAALVTAEDPERALVLQKWAEALMRRADFAASTRVFGEAIAILESQGDIRRAAVAAARFSVALGLVGDTRNAVGLHTRWIPELEAQGPSRELLEVLTSWLGLCQVTGDLPSALSAAERALAVADQLGEGEPLEALLFRGYRRCLAGDRRGLADYRQALDLALPQADSRTIGRIYFNYGADLGMFDGPAAALGLRLEGLELCAKRHDRAISYSLRYGIAHDLFFSGQWSAAIAEIRDLDPLLEAAQNYAELGYLRSLATLLFCETDQARVAETRLDDLTSLGYGPGETYLRSCALVAAARLHAVRGDAAECRRVLTDCFALPDLGNEPGFDWLLPCVARVSASMSDTELVSRAAAHAVAERPLSQCARATTAAICAESIAGPSAAREHFEEAAERWSVLGVPFESAMARLGVARCRPSPGGAAESARALRQARDVFAQLGASTALADTERQLGAVPR